MQQPELLGIANLSHDKAFRVNPWEYKPRIPPNVLESKDRLIRWGQEKTTEHCFFAAAEGLDPLSRVRTKDNPAVVMRGLVLDYDGRVTQVMLNDIPEHCPTEFIPNWAARTFSNGARIVYLFEAPVMLLDRDHARAFLEVCLKKLKLSALLPGLDRDAFMDPSRYYECGREWRNLSNDRIPTNFLNQWMYEAGNKYNWGRKGDEVRIPLTDVYEEVQKQYPGKWDGPFELGCRGNRFWDETADNTTAAVVRESGMQCFTGTTPFVPWGAILGVRFVKKYEANRTGAIIADTFYDGMKYWRKDPTGFWVQVGKDDMRLLLRVKHNLSKKAGKGETFSEIDKVEFAIQEAKAVTAALPFLYRPTGVFVKNGRRFLNTSAVRAMQPAASDSLKWGEGFSFIANLLDNMFDPSLPQLPTFLAWLKRTYDHALALDPVSGQAMAIAGPTGVGKTFLATAIVSPMLGGHVDGSKFLQGDESYSGHALEYPVMLVDDCTPASDHRLRTKFSANLKRIVANSEFGFDLKYQKAGMVEWLGRVMIMLNEDPESIRMLPDMELSNKDKIILLRCARTSVEFPETSELRVIVAQELPYFAAWLHNSWKIPDALKGSSRFGIEPYHEKHLLQSALQEGASYSFFELLVDFLRGWKDTHPKCGTHWEGNATTLSAAMNNDESIAALAKDYKSQTVARLLGQLQSRGFPIERKRSTQHRVWRIPFDLETHEEEI